LLKHDYVPHKIQPVSGYTDLEKAGRELVTPMMESQGGSGGVVVCLGVGGMVDLGPLLGLESEGDDAPYSGVEVWVMDPHRPWNLGNVFGGFPLDPATEISSSYQSRSPAGVDGGKITRVFNPGKGGIIVFDDGDIEEDMEAERAAYLSLIDMPEIDDEGEELGDTDDEDDTSNNFEEEPTHAGQKRKSWSDGEDDSDDDRPRQRRRSNSVRLPSMFQSDFH
jgi:cell division control protein 45